MGWTKNWHPNESIWHRTTYICLFMCSLWSWSISILPMNLHYHNSIEASVGFFCQSMSVSETRYWLWVSFVRCSGPVKLRFPTCAPWGPNGSWNHSFLLTSTISVVLWKFLLSFMHLLEYVSFCLILHYYVNMGKLPPLKVKLRHLYRVIICLIALSLYFPFECLDTLRWDNYLLCPGSIYYISSPLNWVIPGVIFYSSTCNNTQVLHVHVQM